MSGLEWLALAAIVLLGLGVFLVVLLAVLRAAGLADQAAEDAHARWLADQRGTGGLPRPRDRPGPPG